MTTARIMRWSMLSLCALGLASNLAVGNTAALGWVVATALWVWIGTRKENW